VAVGHRVVSGECDLQTVWPRPILRPVLGYQAGGAVLHTIVPAGHVEPVPRRIRAFLGGQAVLDTTGRPVPLGVAELPALLRPHRRRGCARARRRGPRAPPAARDHPTPRLHQRLLARVGDAVHPDLAWAYEFPTRQLQPIVGLVAFYNEQVDVSVDGERLPRPMTHFSRSAR
jgi:hypothetical protein